MCIGINCLRHNWENYDKRRLKLNLIEYFEHNKRDKSYDQHPKF